MSELEQLEHKYFLLEMQDKWDSEDYKYANETCFTQFNCNKLVVSRDAIGGDTSYKVYVNISLTSSMLL